MHNEIVLNTNQQLAVDWNKGPLLVLAGPGSGKTRVLTSRIERILKESEGQYFRILALTFTKKAATEMRERVEEQVPGFMSRVRLTTFHSFCTEVLQQHGSHRNISPDFQILSEDNDRIAIIEDVLFKIQVDKGYLLTEGIEAKRVLPLINRMLEINVSIQNARSHLKNLGIENLELLADVYCKYRSYLKERNVLDFPSLLSEASDLLEIPAFASHFRKIYKHIMIDEFQDTNQLQYDILTKFVKPDPSTLFAVADDDQVIYQWNGADPSRIDELVLDFNATVLQLPENYRSPTHVVHLANNLIAHNPNRFANKDPQVSLKPENQTDKTIRAKYFSSDDNEYDWVAEDISKRTEVERGKCVVLGRTKKLIEEVGIRLVDKGIDVYYSARKVAFETPFFIMLDAILRLANRNDDNKALHRLCKAIYEIEGINIKTDDVIVKGNANGNNLLRVFFEELSSRSNDLHGFSRDLLLSNLNSFINTLGYTKFADDLIKWSTKMLDSIEQLGHYKKDFEEEYSVWKGFNRDIEKNHSNAKIELHSFLRELDLAPKNPTKSPSAVSCYTIHSAKGLEFRHVYLMGLAEEVLPSWQAVKRGETSHEMQEERRNCFVALTRAQESLTLTFAGHYFGYPKRPSRFISEMGFKFGSRR